MKHTPYGPYEAYFKRPLDLLIGLTVIALFWWVYLILAILVRTKLGSPVLFTQQRPGKGGKIFRLMKFRSMTDARDANGELLPDDVRLTRFGRLLRASSLDELPEIFNILKGDMSFIGPRPLLVQYLPWYTPKEQKRHDVRPGLTGWAQVNGRNNLDWDSRLACDVEYAEKITFATDMKILLLTVKKVLCRSDIQVDTADEGYFDEIRRQQAQKDGAL